MSATKAPAPPAAPLTVVTGTGTGLGKTHVTEALLRRLAEAGPVVGWKPVESGVVGAVGDDARRLADASTFHVKRSDGPALPHVALAAPVSPELAARREGRAVDVASFVAAADAHRRAHPDVHVVAELPGGSCSPLAPQVLAMDLAAWLAPTALLLVAPDRLGVLSEVIAATRALATLDLRAPVGVVLVAPEVADASTGTNAGELRRWLAGPLVFDALPRAAVVDLVAHPRLVAVADAITRAARAPATATATA